MATLTLIRGLPGSGKSTLAKVKIKTDGGRHLETDMFFTDNHGRYVFDAKRLTEAHEWCLKMTKFWLKSNVDVYVSNTFTQRWEMEEYFKLVDELKCVVDVETCNANYGSIHDVPAAVIEKMKLRWEHI